MNTADLIWMNGEFVAWEDAKVHVLTHALHYGTVGVRGRARLRDSRTAARRSSATTTTSTRLENSARLYYMDLPFSQDELREATHELIARNGFKSCYIRPLVYRGYGPMGLDPLDNPVEAAIAVWEWAPYLGEEGKRNGVRAKVSSWRRISPESLIPHSKAGGQYLNSVLAKIESKKAGYEEAHPARRARQRLRGHGREHLRDQGRRDLDAAARPTRSSTGSTASRSSRSRATSGYEVVERDIARAELMLADEIFLVGTACELTPVREIDDHRDRPARRDHAPDRAGLRRRPARPRRALREVARPRAGTIQGVNASTYERIP